MRLGCIAMMLVATCALAQSRPAQQTASQVFRSWLEDDARWIITPSERAAFLMLRNDEERDSFIENFWLRRDPTPDTIENEFKDEHYRRLAYANEHYGGKLPGRMTDRGRIYIEFGKPDNIEKVPVDRELWHYRYIDNLGQNIVFEFALRGGDWTLVKDPSGGRNVFGLMPSQYPCPGNTIGCIGLVKYPPVRFKDLEEVVSHKISYQNSLPVDVATDASKVTNATDLVKITLSMPNSKLQWRESDGEYHALLRMFVRFSTLTGRIAGVLEEEVTDSVPDSQYAERAAASREYIKTIPLRPGRYRVDAVVDDMNADRVGYYAHSVLVPEFPADELLPSM